VIEYLRVFRHVGFLFSMMQDGKIRLQKVLLAERRFAFTSSERTFTWMMQSTFVKQFPASHQPTGNKWPG
jgi:hypothetical protein